MMPSDFDEHVHDVMREFARRIRERTYSITPGSPWPSELAAVIATARYHGVNLMVEGGTFLGQSAWAFATMIPAEVITHDLDEAAALQARTRFQAAGLAERIVVIIGDAYDRIPEASTSMGTRGHGVFLDGPKGTTALVLVQRLIETNTPALKFIAIHDTYQSRTGRPNPIRAALFELGRWTEGWRHWTTDDSAWSNTGARLLDEGLYEQHRRLPHGWTPYQHWIHGTVYPNQSYGPTVTILERRLKEGGTS